LTLHTPDGDVTGQPDLSTRFLWVGRPRMQAMPITDLGDVPVDQPRELAISLLNLSSTPLRPTDIRTDSYRAVPVQYLSAPEIPSGGVGEMRVRLTPTELGPSVIQVLALVGDQAEAATAVRLWAIPPP
jgi:hypothetical protein